MPFVHLRYRKQNVSYSSDQPLPVKRAFKCDVRIGSRMVHAEFIVIKGTGEPLLGRETAMKLGVLKIGTNISAVTDLKQSLQSQYPEVFGSWYAEN